MWRRRATRCGPKWWAISVRGAGFRRWLKRRTRGLRWSNSGHHRSCQADAESAHDLEYCSQFWIAGVAESAIERLPGDAGFARELRNAAAGPCHYAQCVSDLPWVIALQ